VARKLFWVSLALTPITLVVHSAFGVGGTPIFVLSAAALTPLAFLIGEATEHVAEHTGAGIGGFLNASFGNAPELIIALFAIGSNLPDVVRGSITGSVVSTSLLVFGGAMAVGRDGDVDRRSRARQRGMVLVAGLLFLVPSIPAMHGNPERHSLYLLTLPVAGVLLALYLSLTFRNLRRHHAAHTAEPAEEAWTLRRGIAVLAAATVATALVSELLVHSLASFGHALGLSEFFVAVVIVAIVGNAAEHGGAIVTARRGNANLAAEIAVSSAAQVAVFVAPTIALISFLVGRGLPLSFRPIELVAMGGAGIVVAITLADGRTRRWEGYLLIAIYAAAVTAFGFAGDR
jgi:Ca2+:H+ antiporter